MNKRFEETITTRERLREIIKPPSRFVANKVINQVDEYCARFIGASPFVVLATTSADGAVDLSPKGDPAGFVQVLDRHTLAVPERPGNHRADSMCNLLEDDRIGLIVLVPGKRETLRISGRASIVRDRALLDRMAHQRKVPELAIVIEVRRAFFHCAKCIIRSHLWQPQAWPETGHLPSLAETMKHHGRLADRLDEVEEVVQRDARDRLY